MKIAYTIKQGPSQFEMMLCGLYIASATFKMLKKTIFYVLTSEVSFVYQDEIAIVKQTLKEYLSEIQLAFQKSQNAHLK